MNDALELVAYVLIAVGVFLCLGVGAACIAAGLGLLSFTLGGPALELFLNRHGRRTVESQSRARQRQ